MPSVGARRSTRVFVPKTAGSAATAARVLRSGKRLAISEGALKKSRNGDGWLRFFGADGGRGGGSSISWFASERDVPACTPEPIDVKLSCAGDSLGSKSFGIVYSRKRRRAAGGGDDAPDGRFGVVFARKGRRKQRKVAPFAGIVPKPSLDFAARSGFAENEYSIAGEHVVILAVLLEPLGTSNHSQDFLTVLLQWMRRKRPRISGLAAFLFSSPIASLFARYGVHCLPFSRSENDAVTKTKDVVPCGLCKLYGVKLSVPLIWTNYSALPSYFRGLHISFLLASVYLSLAIRRSLASEPVEDPLEEENDDDIGATSVFDAVATPETAAGTSHVPAIESSGFVNRSRKTKVQRKRSLNPLLDSQIDLRSSMVLRSGPIKPMSPKTVKRISVQPEHSPSIGKPLRISLADLLSNGDDSDTSTPLGSHEKQKRSALRSPVERLNEKMALADLRQNIDAVRCRANLLVTQGDRCWREEAAEVSLEPLESSEWCVVARLQGIVRVVHKAQDLRPCIVNRFTHAYMWAIDESQKLEFLDKWNWVIFKELHMECRERNSQGKAIPVPGVWAVVDSVDITAAADHPFIRPESYIRLLEDEVHRALTKREAIYDMDSEDEEWLQNLRVTSGGESCLLPADEFEKIMSIFEKDAFDHSEGGSEKEKVVSLCHHLADGDVVASVHEYWAKKRSKKGSALVRTFQGAPMKREQLIQTPFFRKKRSFKRQRSHAGRGKPEVFLQDWGEVEAFRRVQEAEAAASRAVATAIRARNKAQSLMAKAELTTYKSIMALRIAEAYRTSPHCLPSLLPFNTSASGTNQ